MFVNLDTIEAIAGCLVEEADKGEKKLRSEVDQERELVTEFGRCLRQVIDSACRTRGEFACSLRPNSKHKLSSDCYIFNTILSGLPVGMP